MSNLPMRPTPHERDGRDETPSVAAEMARTAHELHLDGYDNAQVQQALVADELTIELLRRPMGGTQ